MDAVLYVVAAVILLVLIVFAVKVRGRTEEGEGNIDINPAAVKRCLCYYCIMRLSEAH